MAPQALPTKQDFLATGLEPVEHDECSICYAEPMTLPVSVKCDGKHAFCRECIVTWLDQPEVNSCPMCRQRLFSANEPAEEVVPQDLERDAPLRRAQVEAAFQAHMQFRYSSEWAFRDLRPWGNDPAEWAAYAIADLDLRFRRAECEDSWQAYLQLRRSADWAFEALQRGF
jgi:hypothetical protein